MFFHHFHYTLKALLKNKSLIFWTFAFPLILGTFFTMAFRDIEKKEQFDIMDIAIVETDDFQNDSIFRESFQRFGDTQREDCLFSIQYVTLEQAEDLLKKKEVIGYFLLQDTPKVVVHSSGIAETIFKQFVEEIVQQKKMISKFLNSFPEADKFWSSSMMNQDSLYDSIVTNMESFSTSIVDVTSSRLSYTMIEFYTLIAMACLYGGILGMVSIHQVLPNMSDIGKRVAVSPISKIKLIFSSVLASFLVQLFGVFLLLIYTIFVLKVDYGTHFPFVALLAIIGSFAGLSFGIFIACCCKGKEATKTGIIITFTMLGCFLAGMMGITMKYVIDKNIPLLNRINPANMITDGFYSLYYYDTYHRYFLNVVSLLIFSILMLGFAGWCLRRQKYDSV